MSSAFDRLKAHAQQWHVAIERTFETESSVLAFGERKSARVVLKIIKHLGDEWHSGDILRAFDGDGMVRVHESDAGAVLLERLDPGNELVKVVREGNDERATETLARVTKQLAGHAAPDGCATVFDWARGFDRYLNTANKQLPANLVYKAQDVYHGLAMSSSRTMLLHGIFIRGTAAPVIAAIRINRPQIQLGDSVEHRPHQVPLRDPIAQRRRHQKHLLAVTTDEPRAHAHRIPPQPDELPDSLA